MLESRQALCHHKSLTRLFSVLVSAQSAALVKPLKDQAWQARITQRSLGQSHLSLLAMHAPPSASFCPLFPPSLQHALLRGRHHCFCRCHKYATTHTQHRTQAPASAAVSPAAAAVASLDSSRGPGRKWSRSKILPPYFHPPETPREVTFPVPPLCFPCLPSIKPSTRTQLFSKPSACMWLVA